ncbi:MAG TPA: sulfotransferase domain-containing protein [Tepidisphaeraceae bacterium]|jgi:hypothetical protein
MRIIVTEFPKSGGSWLTTLLGDALALPKRDIEVKPELFDLRRHPWYAGAESWGLTESCVIKSHELPDSPKTDFPARYLHLIRDGCDVVVSMYFFETEFCVKNGIYKEFEVPFDVYVARTAQAWRDYVTRWRTQATNTVRYEDLLADPVATVQKALRQLELSAPLERLRAAVEQNTAGKFSQKLSGLFAHNTFVRKATRGDWRNHFTRDNAQTFRSIAGDLLVELGYEQNLDW